MCMLDVCLLGCGGSMPIPERFLTSLLLSYNGKMVLIDCGEGTQVSMRLLGWGFKAIEGICLTHFHGDHIIGLPGLLLTIANSGRTEPLTIAGPPGLREVLQGLRVVTPYLPYDLQLLELPETEPYRFQLAGLHVSTLPVRHTVPCLSYGIEVQRQRKFLPERAKELQIPVHLWKILQAGKTVRHEGRQIVPDQVLGPERKGIRVHYCTDSRPTPELVEFIKDCDLFVCEGMYAEEDKLLNAEAHGHMLFREAAELARDGHVQELWLTHFSPSLTQPEAYWEQVKTIFPNTKIGSDRLTVHLTFSNP
jgi:ribonuclease Z